MGGATCPNGSLVTDGSSYAATSYTALCLAIGNGNGGSESGCASGNFNVPDYRGRFLRGVTGSSTNDPDSSSRTAMNTGGNTGNNVGSIQGYQVQSHNHSINDPGHAHTLPIQSGGPYNSGGGLWPGPGSQISSNTATTGITINNTGGNETRPINAYVNYCIFY